MATTLSNWTIDPVHSRVEFSLDSFVCLLLPLVLRETAPSPADGLRA